MTRSFRPDLGRARGDVTPLGWTARLRMGAVSRTAFTGRSRIGDVRSGFRDAFSGTEHAPSGLWLSVSPTCVGVVGPKLEPTSKKGTARLARPSRAGRQGRS